MANLGCTPCLISESFPLPPQVTQLGSYLPLADLWRQREYGYRSRWSAEKAELVVGLFFFFFFLDFIYLFLERGEGKEKEREWNIDVWLPLLRPQLGTWSTTQACALAGNRTSDPLVHRPAPNPLSYTSQGSCWSLPWPHIHVHVQPSTINITFLEGQRQVLYILPMPSWEWDQWLSIDLQSGNLDSQTWNYVSSHQVRFRFERYLVRPHSWFGSTADNDTLVLVGKGPFPIDVISYTGERV